MRKMWLLPVAFLLAALPALAQNPQPIKSNNASVTITTGLTYQVLWAPKSNYNSVTFENNNLTTTDTCYVDLTGLVQPGNTTATSVVTPFGVTLTAAQASIQMVPGGSYGRYYPKLPSNQIVVTCTTSGDSLYADFQ